MAINYTPFTRAHMPKFRDTPLSIRRQMQAALENPRGRAKNPTLKKVYKTLFDDTKAKEHLQHLLLHIDHPDLTRHPQIKEELQTYLKHSHTEFSYKERRQNAIQILEEELGRSYDQKLIHELTKDVEALNDGLSTHQFLVDLAGLFHKHNIISPGVGMLAAASYDDKINIPKLERFIQKEGLPPILKDLFQKNAKRAYKEIKYLEEYEKSPGKKARMERARQEGENINEDNYFIENPEYIENVPGPLQPYGSYHASRTPFNKPHIHLANAPYYDLNMFGLSPLGMAGHEYAHGNVFFNTRTGNPNSESKMYGMMTEHIPFKWKKYLEFNPFVLKKANPLYPLVESTGLHDVELNESYSDLQSMRPFFASAGYDSKDPNVKLTDEGIDKTLEMFPSLKKHRFFLGHTREQIKNAFNEIPSWLGPALIGVATVGSAALGVPIAKQGKQLNYLNYIYL